MCKNIRLATVRLANKVLHMVPEGNRHAVCGVVAEHGIHGLTAARSIAAGMHRICKNCMRVKPVRDLNPAPVDEITDTWQVTNKAGESLGRVTARDIQGAMRIAEQHPTTAWVSKREGGLSFQRLRESQL